MASLQDAAYGLNQQAHSPLSPLAEWTSIDGGGSLATTGETAASRLPLTLEQEIEG